MSWPVATGLLGCVGSNVTRPWAPEVLDASGLASVHTVAETQATASMPPPLIQFPELIEGPRGSNTVTDPVQQLRSAPAATHSDAEGHDSVA